MEGNRRILVVDDDPLIRGSLYEHLKSRRLEVEVAADGVEAIERLKKSSYQLVLCDLKMPHRDGMSVLSFVQSRYPQVRVVLITGFASLPSVIEALRAGALDYLTKPIQPEELDRVIQRVLQEGGKPTEESTSGDGGDPFSDLVGEHASIRVLRGAIERVANSSATILLVGESGTGKRVVAHALHRSDAARKSRPFVEVSCGALTETLLESELFGHIRGAFTGAIRDKQGRFEMANGGTIFLDEIDTCSLALQVKLLRVLQERSFERVGDTQTVRVDVRVVAATNRPLEGLVKAGSFREDLYYRLHVIPIHLPPLRERVSDIPLLAQHFLRRACAKLQKPTQEIQTEAMEMLKSYPWPGNVRELENSIERAVILSTQSLVTVEDLPEKVQGGTHNPAALEVETDASAGTLKASLRDPEREIILKVLKEVGYNRTLAAQKLGIHRATLYHKLRKLGLDPGQMRRDALA